MSLGGMPFGDIMSLAYNLSIANNLSRHQSSIAKHTNAIHPIRGNSPPPMHRKYVKAGKTLKHNRFVLYFRAFVTIFLQNSPVSRYTSSLKHEIVATSVFWIPVYRRGKL